MNKESGLTDIGTETEKVHSNLPPKKSSWKKIAKEPKTPEQYQLTAFEMAARDEFISRMKSAWAKHSALPEKKDEIADRILEEAQNLERQGLGCLKQNIPWFISTIYVLTGKRIEVPFKSSNKVIPFLPVLSGYGMLHVPYLSSGGDVQFLSLEVPQNESRGSFLDGCKPTPITTEAEFNKAIECLHNLFFTDTQLRSKVVLALSAFSVTR